MTDAPGGAGRVYSAGELDVIPALRVYIAFLLVFYFIVSDILLSLSSGFLIFLCNLFRLDFHSHFVCVCVCVCVCVFTFKHVFGL